MKKIRPFTIHILIITFFVMLGVVLFTAEFFSSDVGGWWFDKYAFTKLYFLILVVYSLFSTLVVSLTLVIYKYRNKTFTKLAVILCHVVPIILVWTFIHLGLHDIVDDKLREKEDRYRVFHEEKKVEENKRRLPPVSPEFDRKKLELISPKKEIETEKLESK